MHITKLQFTCAIFSSLKSESVYQLGFLVSQIVVNRMQMSESWSGTGCDMQYILFSEYFTRIESMVWRMRCFAFKQIAFYSILDNHTLASPSLNHYNQTNQRATLFVQKFQHYTSYRRAGSRWGRVTYQLMDKYIIIKINDQGLYTVYRILTRVVLSH